MNKTFSLGYSDACGVCCFTIINLDSTLGIRQSAETENYMTSVQRAFEYSNLKPEAPLEQQDGKNFHLMLYS